MPIIIYGNEIAKEELAFDLTQQAIIWVNDIRQFHQYTTADAFIDLQFRNSTDRIATLQSLLPKPVIINSVIDTLAETNPSFIRINAWPSFLQSPLIEASAVDEDMKRKVAQLFGAFNKQIQWLPDEPGFVTPRVISMIINEAYLALSEGVSTKEEIDIAMKLGTAYPYGPFDWSRKMGLKNIASLLLKLSHRQKRYRPCNLLLQEAGLA